MRVLVGFVSCIIFLTFASVWITVLLPAANYWLGTPLGLIQVMFMIFTFCMTSYSYYVIVTTGPGKIPLHWVPEGFTQEELEEARQLASSQEASRKRNADFSCARFCAKCDQFKPPRAHHCSECDCCVPKMDHHCPWVNNCVGNANHKVFVVFLFWASFGIGYAIIVFIGKVILLFINIMNEEPISMTPLQGVIITINLCILVPFELGIISLASWQIGLALRNTTTVEFHAQRWAIREAKRRKQRYRWPYDFGSTANWKSFFGNSPLRWCIPVVPDNLGNGLVYPTAFEIVKGEYNTDDIIDV